MISYPNCDPGTKQNRTKGTAIRKVWAVVPSVLRLSQTWGEQGNVSTPYLYIYIRLHDSIYKITESLISHSAKVMQLNAIELKKSFKSCKECFYIPYEFIGKCSSKHILRA